MIQRIILKLGNSLSIIILSLRHYLQVHLELSFPISHQAVIRIGFRTQENFLSTTLPLFPHASKNFGQIKRLITYLGIRPRLIRPVHYPLLHRKPFYQIEQTTNLVYRENILIGLAPYKKLQFNCP